MGQNNEELGWPRVLCLELNGGVVVDRKVLHYDYDTGFNYVEDRVDKCMWNGYIPDNELFVVLYHPSRFTPESLAAEDLPQHARKHKTELKDNCGWEILADGPLRLVAFCRDEGYGHTPENMTALAESPRYEDFCRRYERDPQMAIQGNLRFPKSDKERIGDLQPKEKQPEREAEQKAAMRDTSDEKREEKMTNKMKWKR